MEKALYAMENPLVNLNKKRYTVSKKKYRFYAGHIGGTYGRKEKKQTITDFAGT